MKIGDKVRFLSEVGGGVVRGFQGKDIVLVEDEDGFEIPMLKSEVVVIGEKDISFDDASPSKPAPAAGKGTGSSASHEAATPKPLPREEVEERMPRTGTGVVLNLYLAFVPDDVKRISDTTFEAYFVNDSDFYVQVLYLSAEGANWRARFCATLEPNTKVFVEEFDRSRLGELERLAVQVMAWKPDRVFPLKATVSTELRLDCTKFYKMHIFQPNEFFRDPNWTVPVIRDDKPVRSIFPDAEGIREALLSRPGEKAPSVQPARTSRPDPSHSKPNQKPTLVEVDLHIEQLLDTTAGLSAGDLLMVQMKEFRRVMDQHAGEPGSRIVFIHGKGEGVLRKNILQELRSRYKHCTAQDASFREYGFGATMVKVGTKSASAKE
ncbi:MAG: DUF2027 domain-containing protein [Bacteroidaceae bacterium]|nr:DUF2027 domain-containing protein [Bacteroidaceae bacterium]